jgi:hypothetical protein
VDNPGVKLLINGKVYHFEGNTLHLPLWKLGKGLWESGLIKAEAIDSEGRTGTDEASVVLNYPIPFTVNLPNEVTYTNKASITVQGEVGLLKPKVYINGIEVVVINNHYEANIPLKEGFNLLSLKAVANLKCFSQDNEVSRTIQKVVVFNTTKPELHVTYPAAGQLTSSDQIQVRGEVSSLLPVTVFVAGKVTIVTNNAFISEPILLIEGENNIEVKAVDKSGAEISTKLTLFKDSTRPLLIVTDLIDNGVYNKKDITIAGTFSDSSKVKIIVNNQPSFITNNTFTTLFSLNEGWNKIEIKAWEGEDNDGNLIIL